jgi:hypothetical protein
VILFLAFLHWSELGKERGKQTKIFRATDPEGQIVHFFPGSGSVLICTMCVVFFCPCISSLTRMRILSRARKCSIFSSGSAARLFLQVSVALMTALRNIFGSVDYNREKKKFFPDPQTYVVCALWYSFRRSFCKRVCGLSAAFLTNKYF